ncbi:serine/threonine-protein kinase [Hyalangium versicolor]|uniref:serine/threonine-protein kinase n=1 Tax=Hyalangium versicolor TaxID=2861190 RepID=UPI001CCA2378|nr:serine/threonine-protein kinase [Hyalangium versicolor]
MIPDDAKSPASTEREALCPTRVRPEGWEPTSEQWWASPQASSGTLPKTLVPMASSDDPLVGLELGSFRIVRKLGGGGMGTVYLAEHTLIGSKVAVKFLHEHFASNETLIQRCMAEARIVNLIGHENIINIFDTNVLPPRRHYLVMEYLEGSPLTVLTGAPVEPSVAVPILTQVCDALQAAHFCGVVHRDLKPENIFLVRRDRMQHFVKVLDFGIAKLTDNVPQEQTSAGTLLGTPEYMAPEQWYGHAVDGRTDLYALGLIAYELLVGRAAFSKGGLGSLLHAHLMESPPAPHEVRPEVPVALSDVIMRAMAKRPEDRYSTAAEMREALEQAFQSIAPPSTGISEEVPIAPVSSPAPVPGGLSARVNLQPGSPPVSLACVDVAHGGAFLCTEQTPPPLRSRLSLVLEMQGQELPCVAEVVHHVSPAQALGWKRSPGFAVQFQELSEEAREQLAGMAKGKAPRLDAPKETPNDSQAELTLDLMFRRVRTDPYALLCVPLDASFEDVRKHARSTFRSLEDLAHRPLSARQQRDVEEMRSRVEKAADVLGHARQRIEHDAWRSNFMGVARCISSGISVSEIEALQARFLEEHPGAAAAEQIHAHTATAWASQGRTDLALLEYERALRANPLRVSLQQHYWTLKQRRTGSSQSLGAVPERDVSARWLRSEHP